MARKSSIDLKNAKGGGTLNSKYPLYIEGEDYRRLIFLEGHSLVQQTVQQTTPTNLPYAKWNPRTQSLEMQEVATTRRSISRIDFNIGMPAKDYSIMDEIVDSGCIRDVLRMRLDCERCDRLVDLYLPTAPFNQVVDDNELTMGGISPTESLVGRTTGFSSPAKGRMWPLDVAVVATVETSVNEVRWSEGDACADCGFCPDEILLGGTVDNDPDPDDGLFGVLSTDNQLFDTLSSVSGLPSGAVVTDFIVNGARVVGTFRVSTTGGGTFVYENGVLSLGEVGGVAIAEPLTGITRQGDIYIAVGDDGVIYTAPTIDPLNWTLLNVGSTDDFTAIATDGQINYLATATGDAFTLVGSVLTDITSDVDPNNVATTLNAVHVFGEGHIAFGGAAGFFSESLDGGTSWMPVQLNGGTGTIRAIAGEKWRQFVGVDSVLLERSPLTVDSEFVMQFAELGLQGGQTLSGNIMSLDVVKRFNAINYLVGSTDAGEIFYGKPCPASC